MEEITVNRNDKVLLLAVGELLGKSWSIPTIEREYEAAEKKLALYERNQAKPRPPHED
jgi:hypothetical protein